MSEHDIWFLLGHLVCVIQWIVFIQVHWSYHKKVCVKYPQLWSILIVAGALAIALIGKVEFFSAASVVLSFLVLLVSSMLFEGSFGGRLVSSLIGGVMSILTQNTVRYLASWVSKRSLNDVLRSAAFLAVMCLVTVGVGMMVVYMVKRWKEHSALDPLQGMVMSFFPGVVVLLNMILMLSVDPDRVVEPLYLFLMPGLTLAVLVHLSLVFMFNEEVVQRRNVAFRAELEQQRAEALLESYTEQRHLTHEFTNHANAVDALLQQGDVDGARDYMAQVSKIIAVGTTVLNTHNPLLDALLSKKHHNASQQGVRMFFDMCDLSELPVSGMDAVIIVSNALDNAICAAAQATPPEIHVRARKGEDEFILSVRNRVEKDVFIPEDRLPRSTKKEPGHGMGLVNVRDTLTRYNGELKLTCRDRWFRFTCSVPISKT